MLTDAQLQGIMPNLASARRALYLPHLVTAMQTYAIDTALRTAAFVAQLAHESGEFRWMEEIWGPTDPQRRYEPPSDLARRLGNTQAGDGKRFKGRGPIQITGRFNYRKYGDLLGIDLEAEPEQAASPAVAFATAGLYWQRNGLNELADERDFITITKRINGGTNGLADRQKHYVRALAVLVPSASRGRSRMAPLTRGHEAIVEDSESSLPKRVSAKKGLTTKPVRRTAQKKCDVAAEKKQPTTRKAARRETVGKSSNVSNSLARKTFAHTAAASRTR